MIQKRLPSYYQALRNYPDSNPILITMEYVCSRRIQGYGGICLVCQMPIQSYDLSFCFRREVWVLYSHERHLFAALQLAQLLQQGGAAEITIIHLNL